MQNREKLFNLWLLGLLSHSKSLYWLLKVHCHICVCIHTCFLVYRSYGAHSTARSWLSLARSIGLNAVDKIAGIGTDGQYIRSRIPQIFINLIKKPLDDDSICVVWDLGESKVVE